jgi:hypothetical protein
MIGVAWAAEAEPLISYSTSGTIGLTGVSGPNVISFNSVATGDYDAPSSLSLGEFLVAPLAPEVSATYNNTPFSITYLTNSIDGSPPVPNESPITVTGFLSGSITGASQSNVVATFNPLETPDFRTGDFNNTFRILDAAVSLVPSSTNGGRTTAQGRNTVTPVPAVPEPASVAVFLTAIAGVGLRRRGRARKGGAELA